MYAGMAVQPSGSPGMSGASPIPQQWWDQETQQGGLNLSDPYGASPGMNASSKSLSYPTTNAAAAAAENSVLAQRMGVMNLNNDTRVHSYGRYDPNADSGSGAPVGNPPPPQQQRGPTVNGLIRISLKKPMGIVFEPMEDPHNRYQQRGVRICELPRTGAAAMSGMLEVGDELLSINNKPMSRLKFDEIMDFIIDADAENVDLLFRRPKKEKTDKTLEGNKNTNTTVKWDDNIAPPKADNEEETRGRRQASPKRRNDPRDEESLQSGDDTFYTEQTSYTEDTRKDTRRGKRRGRNYHSESFLDMLIDTVCAPVMGGDGGRGDFSDDETFNSMDDRTYDSEDGDSFLERKKKMWQESRKRNTEKLKKSIEDEQKRKKKAERETSRSKKFVNDGRNASSEAQNIENNEHNRTTPVEHIIKYHKPQNPGIINLSDKDAYQKQMKPPSPPSSPPPVTGSSAHHLQTSRRDFAPEPDYQPSSRFMPQVDKVESIEQDLNVPFKEITYDDQVEEQVSVMESVGGPSLLLENLRNAAQIKKTVDEELIAKFGKDFKPDLGLTRDESIQVNPDRFYRFAVKKLLEQNEPEKVRLVDKLFDKYRGREEHLIRKLDARYNSDNIENKQSVDNGKSASTDSGYDGFKAFGGGDGSKSSSAEQDSARDAFGADPWQAHEVPQFQTSHDQSKESGDFADSFAPANEDDNSSYSDSEDADSIDGTSPEVIAQVSELLNYVYGKTTVAGQIDRVSTIMRAYEGREAILLELLETKALIKANGDNGNLEDLPEILRDNPGLDKNPSGAEVQVKKGGQDMMSPMSNVTGPSSSHSSMVPASAVPQLAVYDDNETSSPSPDQKKKKKRGLFGGMFKRKNKEINSDGGGAFPTTENGKRRGSKKGALLPSQR
mmetsp:Transcript_15846/g.29903  ORF Transcript_15846/g.29903 Transcript_15846/m.29903 type:complete len:893 (-) Transcript_15846:77-2755(-)